MRGITSANDFRHRTPYHAPPGGLDDTNTRDQVKMRGIEAKASRLAQTHLQVPIQEDDLIRA